MNTLIPQTLTEVQTVNGESYTTHFDASLGQISVATPAGRTLTIDLDGLGRPVAHAGLGRSPVATTYDGAGRVAGYLQSDGTETRRTDYVYDGLGFLARAVDGNGDGSDYLRDAAGRLTQRRRIGSGATTSFTYDLDGRLMSLSPPGQPAHTFGYDAEGNEVSYTLPAINGGPSGTSRTFDADGRPRSHQVHGGPRLTFNWAGGVLTSLAFPGDTIGYARDPASGRVTSMTTGALTHMTAWDGPLLRSVAWLGAVTGSVEFSYDARLQLSQETVNGMHAIDYTYDVDGLVAQVGGMTITRDPTSGRVTDTSIGVVQTHQTYNSFGELVSRTALSNGAVVYQLLLSRDVTGRITQKVESRSGAGTTTDFGFDVDGRLAMVSEGGAVVRTYQYDPNGNLTSWTASGQTKAATFDVQDRLLVQDGESLSYDAAGAVTARTAVAGASIQYGWDGLGRLASITPASGAVSDFVLDGVGRQVWSDARVSGLLYRDGVRPVAEIDSSGGVLARFAHGTSLHTPDLILMGGTWHRVVTDHLGSVVAVIDSATGAVVQELRYDEWGQKLADSNPGLQPFGFGGGLELVTGAIRFGARVYAPSMRRWLSPGPLGFGGRSTNRYAFAHSDPVNLVEPTGLVAKVAELAFGYEPSSASERIRSDLGIVAEAPGFTSAGYQMPHVPSTERDSIDLGRVGSRSLLGGLGSTGVGYKSMSRQCSLFGGESANGEPCYAIDGPTPPPVQEYHAAPQVSIPAPM